MNSLNIYIRGRVQGVFFRKNAKKQAEKLHITGWCRNEEDGSVRVVAQGTEEHLEKFQEYLSAGEGMALVEGMDVEFIDHKACTTFEIHY